MEYSVYDLVRILLKKWYVILLTVCLIAGLSSITSQTSYAKALADYEEYTSEMVFSGVETGSLVASYRYGYEVSDLSKYTASQEMKADFFEKFSKEFQSEMFDNEKKTSVYALAEQSFALVSQNFAKLLTDATVMQSTQAEIDSFQYQEPPTVDGTPGPLIVANHFAVELTESALRITVSGLDETVSAQILDTYLEKVKAVGAQDYALAVTATENSTSFFADTVQYTDSAKFAQMVMQKPEHAPILVKTAGTAAAYAFVLACFLVLLITFIKETRAAGKSNGVR